MLMDIGKLILTDDKDAWDVVVHESWMNILPSTWAFKCNWFPDGRVQKLKARFCVRGDRQVEGVDFFLTFAPVVNWTKDFNVDTVCHSWSVYPSS